MSTTRDLAHSQLSLGERIKRTLYRWWPLYLMLIPGIVFFAVYKYAPMGGLVLAFKNFKIKKGIWASPWADPWYKYFVQFFKSPANRNIIKNTISISLWKLFVGMFPSLIFALAVSECRKRGFARIVQTVSYLPHFLSWVVVYGIATAMLSVNRGVVNDVIKKLGGEAIPFLNSNKYFQGVIIGTDLWKGLGWGAITYLAAIMSIDTSLYEAATVDGCGRFRQIWHITLPGIRKIFVVLLILKVGTILDAGFNHVYVFLTDEVRSSGEIIDTWVYTQGIGK
ncbi:MAG: sugar ABC transporter permease, partial [Clostridia bacterium]|nr:sugar ABC transporter permease [Clostridia bacterium]